MIGPAHSARLKAAAAPPAATAPRPPARPVPPWVAGAAIGIVLFGMAAGAITMGAGWALTGPRKDT